MGTEEAQRLAADEWRFVDALEVARDAIERSAARGRHDRLQSEKGWKMPVGLGVFESGLKRRMCLWNVDGQERMAG